jgi:glycine cleavage system aminomethyltransferase T
LTGCAADGEIAAGSLVEADGREVGRITSAAFSPGLNCWVALGYVRREYSEPGGEVTIGGQMARVREHC